MGFVHRLYFFCTVDMCWNIFDFGIVTTTWLEMALASFSKQGTQFVFLRLLRLLNCARIIRLMRAIRWINQLRLFIDCLLGCLPSLLWACFLTAFMLCLFGMLLVHNVSRCLQCAFGRSTCED